MFWPNLYSARLCCTYFSLIDKLLWLRDKTLENLWWRAGEVQKYSRKGKLNLKKNSRTPSNPKKYSCYGLKKIHTRNLITKKNSCGPKVPLPPPPPPPPHNCFNGPSLNIVGRFRLNNTLIYSYGLLYNCSVIIHTFFHLRVVLRQLFDTVKGKYQKSKEIATDSNLI